MKPTAKRGAGVLACLVSAIGAHTQQVSATLVAQSPVLQQGEPLQLCLSIVNPTQEDLEVEHSLRCLLLERQVTPGVWKDVPLNEGATSLQLQLDYRRSERPYRVPAGKTVLRDWIFLCRPLMNVGTYRMSYVIRGVELPQSRITEAAALEFRVVPHEGFAALPDEQKGDLLCAYVSDDFFVLPFGMPTSVAPQIDRLLALGSALPPRAVDYLHVFRADVAFWARDFVLSEAQAAAVTVAPAGATGGLGALARYLSARAGLLRATTAEQFDARMKALESVKARHPGLVKAHRLTDWSQMRPR